MKIVLFHPVRLPPKNYGGVERVVLWLAKGLLERGHEVWVAAAPGSELPKGCQLIEVPAEESAPFQMIKRIPDAADVVHFMAPVGEAVWKSLDIPAILTVHGNGKPGEVYPKNTVFLSRDHASRHGASAFVYNGIDPEEYIYQPGPKGNHFLFLSKTGWRVKNVRGAMRIAKKAGVPLWIAGGNRPFLSRVRSYFSKQMKWMGPVAGRHKAEILAGSRALLFPILWPEPFGLVVIEALMSGTPVIGYKRGSLLELIPSHVGALIDPDAEDEVWNQYLNSSALPWNPEACRAWASENFHYLKMAENYEKHYKKVISGETLHETNPIAENWRSQ